MRKLSDKKKRFLGIATHYSALYSYTNQKDQLTVSAGTLNFIWNSWNNFWRDYWLAHVQGGLDLTDTRIIGVHPNYNDKQGCYYLLTLLGRKSSNPGASIAGTWQEVTWGDPKVISNVATQLLPNHPHMNHVLGILSHYQTSLEHFQKIRNSFIHLNNENVHSLNQISAYYSYGPNQELIDILESTHISSSTRCFDHLVDNMKGMMLSI